MDRQLSNKVAGPDMARANHRAGSFFDNPPPRVKLIIEMHRAWVHSPAQYPASVLHGRLSEALADAGFDAPTRREYRDWLSVEREAVYHLSPYQPQPKGPEERVRFTAHATYALNEPAQAIYDGIAAEELQQAVAIVRASHALTQAKIAAGYSPLSCGTDDTVVADAIKTVVSSMHAPILGVTGACTAVDLLLSQCDDDIDGTVLDVLAIDMQRELCAALVKGMAEQGGAA